MEYSKIENIKCRNSAGMATLIKKKKNHCKIAWH